MKRHPKHPKLVNLALVALLLVNSACSSLSGDTAQDVKAALAEHDYAAAQIHVTNALQADPANKELLYLNGKIALEMGNTDLATSEFTKLINDAAYGEKSRPLLAKAYLMGGNPQQALTTLDGSKRDSDTGQAVKISALLAIGKSDEANRLLDSAVVQFPQSVDLGVLVGARQMALGDLDGARATAEGLVKSAPSDPDALLFAGREALSRRDLASAEAHLAALVKMEPWHQTGLLALAAIFRDRGDQAGADRYLKQAQAKAPGNPVSIYLRAQMAYDAGDLDQATKILETAPKEGAPLPALEMLNGLVSAKKGNHEIAIASLQAFLSQGGEDGRARVALATSLDAVGDKAQAWQVLKPVANAANATAGTLKLASRLAQAAGDAGAPTYSQRAIALAKPDPNAPQMKLAEAAIAAGDWQKADRIYAGLLANGNRDNIILLNNAANARLELGDAPGAVSLARQAVALAPADPIVLDTLGWSLYKAQGDGPEVRKLLAQAVQAMPGNVEIRRHVTTVSNAASRKS